MARSRGDEAEDRQSLGRVDERVDDEHLGPVALGDLVDLRMSTALDEERVAIPTDPLQAAA